MKLLIDGDIFAFQAATNCLQEEQVNEEEWSQLVNVADALADFDARIAEWSKRFKAKQVVIAFGSLTYWRRDVMPLYKRNRTGKKPLGYRALVDAIERKYLTRRINRMEADDVVGLMHVDGTIAISDDKDFRQLPGRLFVPRTDEDLTINDWQADVFHMMQTLTGDSADGYPGCKGIGPVGAEKVLSMIQDGRGGRKNLWRAVVDCFASKGFTVHDAIKNAQVARILRPGELLKGDKPKLWEPW